MTSKRRSLIMITEPNEQHTKQSNSQQPRLNLKTLVIRLVLIWFLLGQMLFVCWPAATTKSLSRLETAYAFQPSTANKTALDNEFDRVADYESQRATARFALLLAVDVAVIAFGWNFGNRKRAPKKSANLSAPLLVGQPELN